jgi:LuxR family transcriptional regulator, quorum-sensing system regulator CviR
MDKDIRTILIVRSIAPHFHQALLRLATPLKNRPQAPDPGFSSREKEVLNWVKVGKTTWEISHILSISERTVKFHIQNILRKVHAVTRAQAVAISVENGFIDID